MTTRSPSSGVVFSQLLSRTLASRSPATTRSNAATLSSARLSARTPQLVPAALGNVAHADPIASTPAAIQDASAKPAPTGKSSEWPREIKPVLQADVAEYSSATEARRWGGSSCSAAALTAVTRALTGQDVRVGDVVGELQARGGITVDLGLVSRPALVATAQGLGLSAEDRKLSYEDLATATKNGPVLVDITNRMFPQGHWLVVTGADAGGVSVVDSTGYHLTQLSRADFTNAWSGRGIITTAAANVSQRV